MQLESAVKVGLPFSKNYLRPASLLNDSKRFRVKIAQAFEDLIFGQWNDCQKFLRGDVGLNLSFGYVQHIKEWFSTADIVDLLDAITGIWRFCNSSPALNTRDGYASGPDVANVWHNLVAAAFSMESMGYQLDEKCGVHFFVDSEFEGVRVAAVAGLGSPRYSNVSNSLEKAYRFLDGSNVDTKSAARSAFEALEILAKLIVPEAQNLNGKMIEVKLKPIVLDGCVDDAHKNMASAILDSLKEFVNGVHYYRHGQGEEAVVEPPLAIAIYILSQVSNSIRLLIPIDQRLQSAS